AYAGNLGFPFHMREQKCHQIVSREWNDEERKQNERHRSLHASASETQTRGGAKLLCRPAANRGSSSSARLVGAQIPKSAHSQDAEHGSCPLFDLRYPAALAARALREVVRSLILALEFAARDTCRS